MAQVKLDILLNAVDKASGVLAKVDKQASSMSDRLKASSEQMNRAGNIMIATGAAVMTGLFASAKGAANMGEALLKASQVTGVTVEELSTLKFAAEQSNVSFETLQSGLIKMSRTAAQAAQGSKTADAAFSALGVSVRDAAGQLKTPDKLLSDVAQALSQMQNPTERAAAAMDIFGRSGAQMLPMMEDGAQGIRDLQEEAKALGLGWTRKQAEDGDKFNDSMEKMNETSKQLASTLGKTLLPAMTGIVEKIAEVVGKVTEWINKHPELTEGLAKAAAWIAGVGIAIGGMLKAMSGINAAIKTWEALAAAIKGVSVAAAGAEVATGGAAAAAGGRAAAGAGAAAAGGRIAAAGAVLAKGGMWAAIAAAMAVVAYDIWKDAGDTIGGFRAGGMRGAASAAWAGMMEPPALRAYRMMTGNGRIVHEHRLSSDGQTARTLLSNPEAQASIRRDMRSNAAATGRAGKSPTRP